MPVIFQPIVSGPAVSGLAVSGPAVPGRSPLFGLRGGPRGTLGIRPSSRFRDLLRLAVVSFLLAAFLLAALQPVSAQAPRAALVYQTDFGLKDGAVAAMKGVAFGVSDRLQQFDLTHEIPAFNIWEAAYRLHQTLAYWPVGTVFVSVVDPGVGSSRLSVVAKTKSGHFIVTPDNGTLTLVATAVGIDSLRQIDESRNRLPGSGGSYTFHGRDVYAFTGARLAAGVIRFHEVGPEIPPHPVVLPFQPATAQNGVVRGNIPVLDVQYGNAWTNIPVTLLHEQGVSVSKRLKVVISDGKRVVYRGTLRYGNTFSDVPEGEAIAYANSLMNLAFGINRGNFSEKHQVKSGAGWTVELRVQ